MKKVDIPQLILKQYSNGEVVHYLASKLRDLSNLILDDDARWNEYNFGTVMANLEGMANLATALDKKMNGDNGTNIVV